MNEMFKDFYNRIFPPPDPREVKLVDSYQTHVATTTSVLGEKNLTDVEKKVIYNSYLNLPIGLQAGTVFAAAMYSLFMLKNRRNASKALYLGLTEYQFVGTASLSLTFTVFVANMYPQTEKYTKNIASLPLQAGASPFCYILCPNLMQQEYMERRRNKEMVDNPTTENLKNYQTMVHNCWQREQMIKDLTKSRKRPNYPYNVPEPGVPWNYLGIKVDKEEKK